MFDISALKEMKLSELQEIAKSAKTIKFNGVKKETLISQILEHQTASVDSTLDKNKESNIVSTVDKKQEDTVEDDKPKRARIIPVKKVAIQKTPATSAVQVEETQQEVNAPAEVIIPEATITPVESSESKPVETETKPGKIVKFSKSAYEKKIALKKDKEEVKETPKGNEVAADSGIEENIEVPAAPIKKINPNQLHKQNPNANQNVGANGNQNPNFKNKKSNFKDSDFEFNGAYLSWQNTWHGWGNSQAYALLKAYQVLNDEKIKTSALSELNNFYERLIEKSFFIW